MTWWLLACYLCGIGGYLIGRKVEMNAWVLWLKQREARWK